MHRRAFTGGLIGALMSFLGWRRAPAAVSVTARAEEKDELYRFYRITADGLEPVLFPDLKVGERILCVSPEHAARKPGYEDRCGVEEWLVGSAPDRSLPVIEMSVQVAWQRDLRTGKVSKGG